MKWDQIQSQLFPNDIHDFSAIMNRNQDTQFLPPLPPSRSPSNTSAATSKKSKSKKKNSHKQANSTASSLFNQQSGHSNWANSWPSPEEYERLNSISASTGYAPRQNQHVDNTDAFSNASYGSKNSSASPQRKRAAGGRKERSKLHISSEQGHPQRQEWAEQLYEEPRVDAQTPKKKKNKKKNKNGDTKQEQPSPKTTKKSKAGSPASEKGAKKGGQKQKKNEASPSMFDTGIKAFNIQKADASGERPIGASIEVVDVDASSPGNGAEGTAQKKKKNKKKSKGGEENQDVETAPLSQCDSGENKEIQHEIPQVDGAPVLERESYIPSSVQGPEDTPKYPDTIPSFMKEKPVPDEVQTEAIYQEANAEDTEVDKAGNEEEADEESEEEEEVEEDDAASAKNKTRKEVRIKLDLNLEMELVLKTRIKGEIMITFL